MFVQDNRVYLIDYENSKPSLGHLVSAPPGRGLFIPESMVDKIEQKDSKKESEATKPAEEMEYPKYAVLEEQQKVAEEADHNTQRKELKEILRVRPDEVTPQMEHLKRLQEKHLKSNINKGTEDGSCFRQPIVDPNNRQLQQAKLYYYN